MGRGSVSIFAFSSLRVKWERQHCNERLLLLLLVGDVQRERWG